MALKNHPLRSRIGAEIHMRRMAALQAPCQMLQVVRIVEAADHGRERAHAAAMPGVVRSEAQSGVSHISGVAAGGIAYMWERHSEATTSTVVLPRRAAAGVFADEQNDAEAMRWLSDAPGSVIRAVRIGIVATGREAEAVAATCSFAESDLVSCYLGKARIWTDFHTRGDGFGRLLVAANGVPPNDLGRLVQRVQELGNYRNMALMGLPLAQEKAREVAEAEAAIVDLAGRMAAGEDDRALLDELSALASRVTSLTAATAYRMSATAAYAAIATDRLQQLDCTPVEGCLTLDEFTERRLLPAARTCSSFVLRLESLSGRIERATSLLRTRVEMSVEEQNVALLQSMNRTAVRQVRIQKLVEGLSVMAVSYYAVGLLSYLAKGVSAALGTHAEILAAAAVIPVLLVVWIYLRGKVRRIEQEGED
ncbi:DUF3422 domain-containing protein [Sandaracinobacteroides hominis]|uniref:DUF3422 domain-containing protein n=1 Tax=Sandaracinobacteroides hominis TaxID=2780086 RepID=UPI0018F5FE8F|nr:DUF3422 domain-containing protein [Sandaracinobacteroides hominis]